MGVVPFCCSIWCPNLASKASEPPQGMEPPSSTPQLVRACACVCVCACVRQLDSEFSYCELKHCDKSQQSSSLCKQLMVLCLLCSCLYCQREEHFTLPLLLGTGSMQCKLVSHGQLSFHYLQIFEECRNMENTFGHVRLASWSNTPQC